MDVYKAKKQQIKRKIHSFNHKPHYTKTMTTLTTNTSTDQCTQPSLPLNLQAVAEEDDNTITISWNVAPRKNDNCKHNKITKYEIKQTRSSHSEGDIMHTTQSTGETKEALSSFPTTPGISKLSSVEKILTYEVNEVNDVDEVNEVDEVNVVTEDTEIELKFVINLIKGEEYTFAVRAMNENGTWSPWTNSVGPIFVPFETIFKVSQTQNIKFTNTCLFDFFHSSLILFIPTRFPECLFTSC